MSSPRKFTWAAPQAGRGPNRRKRDGESSPATPSKRRRVISDIGEAALKEKHTLASDTASSTASLAFSAPAVASSSNGAGAVHIPSKPAQQFSRRPTNILGARFTPTISPRHPSGTYEEYKDVVERRGGLYKIDPRTWIAELYNGSEENRRWGIDAWTIVQRHVSIIGGLSYTCSPCPDFAHYKTCAHVMLLDDADFPELLPYWDEDDPECICFEQRRLGTDGTIGSMFILASGASKHIVVSHHGKSVSSGTWTCSKDGAMVCEHACIAKTNPGFLHGFEDEEDDRSEEDGEVDDAVRRAAAERESADRNSVREMFDERSISWLPVGPPLWSRLPEDKVQSFPASEIPSVLRLGKNSRCRCGWVADDGGDVIVQPAVVYGLTKATAVNIEVKRCIKCPAVRKQFAGPDLREFAIFNFNNNRLYTHELLNNFTTSSSLHETPFHSFSTLVARSYIEANSPIPFVPGGAFRTAYFSFTKIQDFGDSFQCPECGPNPRVVIFDGVTAGFKNKHQTSSLCPPTLIMPSAPVRDNVRPPIRPTSLVWGKLRIQAQKAVRWRMQARNGKSSVSGIGVEDDTEESDADAADADVDLVGASKETKKRVSRRDAMDQAIRDSIPRITSDLARLDKHLASMFARNVTPDLEPEDRKIYLELLEHVFAAESALLFVPKTTWLALSMLLRGDESASGTLLREVPAIGSVARLEYQRGGGYSEELKGVVKYVLDRAVDVLSTLPQHDYDPAIEETTDADWRETGVCYGRPRVRLRPQYPNLPTDQKVDRAVVSGDAVGGIGCNKFYETYGKRDQTGGLMAAWCPHSVCLGFHCIPKGEGRNDVFSAMYTRWEVPPEVVIYDFACALGPYCMLREPQFFGRTKFLIDSFHAKGHTRCTKACFITTYKKNTPELKDVNSSAAECGNGGLRKIRRPLSYMSQRHAIIYAHNYLACWNRSRRLAQLEKKKAAAAAGR